MTKISIITVSYNSSKTISRTIESLLNQTYSNYEYIVVDGNSKDNTQKIIANYECKFEGRLKWISESDSGIYEAMNKGIRMAHGDIIGIVNSDDWLESNALEIIATKYEEVPVELRKNTLLCGAIRFHYDDGPQVFDVNKNLFYKNIKRQALRGAWHPGIYVPKEVYSKYGLFDEKFRIIGDVDFIYRCYVNQCNFEFIHDVISNMADGGASNSRNCYFTEDRKYICRKYNYSKPQYYYTLAISYFVLWLKQKTPQRLLKMFRNFKYSNR